MLSNSVLCLIQVNVCLLRSLSLERGYDNLQIARRRGKSRGHQDRLVCVSTSSLFFFFPGMGGSADTVWTGDPGQTFHSQSEFNRCHMWLH